MSSEKCLHDVAYLVQQLLGCSAVTLQLNCPEPALRHPLLDICPLTTGCATTWCSSNKQSALLCNEQVAALQDSAIQTGLPQCRNSLDSLYQERGIGSVLIAPLVRPMGTLGVLLCGSTHASAFLDGEVCLLEYLLPTIARNVEEILCDACTLPASDSATVQSLPLHSSIVRTSESDQEVSREQDVVQMLPIKGERFEKNGTLDVQEQPAFISMIGHELRMPLTAIKGYAGLLQAYANTSKSVQQDGRAATPTAELTPEQQQHYLDVIMEQTQHLEVLINDLLDVSRIQAGRLTLRHTEVDIAQLCQRVAQLLQQQTEQQQPGRYCIRCRLDADIPLLWADPDRVQQVLTNLVENAIKYSPDGGLIEIHVQTPHVTAMNEDTEADAPRTRKTSALQGSMMTAITVRDWGIGIPGSQLPSLFHAFRRLEQPETHDIPGFGLGLYISRLLVEAMNGRITLWSREHEGTSVTFMLPTVAAERPDRPDALADMPITCGSRCS